MTADEIRRELTELREELFNLRFRNSMQQLDNPLKIRESAARDGAADDGADGAPEGHRRRAGHE